MKDLDKAICKWSKSQLAERLPVVAAEARSARYVCRKCGRVAQSKSWLCKPSSIEKMLPAESDS